MTPHVSSSADESVLIRDGTKRCTQSRLGCTYNKVLLMRSREAMMAGKYSAEWWEKIADINREISARYDPSSVVDDLIQATASGGPSPMTKSETPLRGAGFKAAKPCRDGLSSNFVDLVEQS